MFRKGETSWKKPKIENNYGINEKINIFVIVGHKDMIDGYRISMKIG